MKLRYFAMLSAAALLGFVVAPVEAGLTATWGPPGGELNHPSILDGIYGASFVVNPPALPPGNPSYTNGTITATRLDDWATAGPNVGGQYAGDYGGTKGAPTPVCYSNGASVQPPVWPASPHTTNLWPFTDQEWIDGTVTVTAQARYAGNSQEFGWDPGAVGGYTKLFDVTGSGFGVTGGVGPIALTGLFGWARADDSDAVLSNPHWSVDAFNADTYDHMVTYYITGPNIVYPTWLLFFEDVTGLGSDRDFNDLVVEVVCIPAPGAVVLGVLGLGLAGWVRRRMS